MRILITGVAGLIGSQLARFFLSKGYEVVGIDNLTGGYRTNLPKHSNFSFFEQDILNTIPLNHTFKQVKPEAVFHCAALPHEGLSVFSPSTITKNIYSGTISVASAAIASGSKYFFNTSSMARYGEGNPPFKETDVLNPQDPYGMAKMQAEQMLNLLSDIHGIKVFHIVPHNVCGPHQCYSDPYRNVLSIFSNMVLQDKAVFIYGDGQQRRSFSHIYDCIKAIDTLFTLRDEISNKEVFNIGPGEDTEITIEELALKVFREFNKEPKLTYLPPRPREVKDAWVDTSKAEAILNYRAHLDVDDTIRDTVAWIKKSPKRSFNYHLDLEIINNTTPKTWTDRLFND